ncbi:TRAP-type mannitol/chloroaromatic compound transport system, small permease component [Limimonas halophila]|uniref:TRAP transporter small permease protein n=1 Tax=Limimonas halophila TaxID=1082479 RepID=A0A1G7TUM3_9PROT|nr:TRAP transporter small permease subunit [Limimonas halophila]SDG38965.1 TRAP-type mannitol/chloroaromatic compound transport system, small permease component [Limimonas halophila]
MPKPVRWYILAVDALSYWVGRLALYLIFVMMGTLLFAAFSRVTFNLSFVWLVETMQFTLVAYFLLGGAYSMQLGSHVRMDLFYERWSERTKAVVDAVTICFLIFYLVFLLYGGIASTEYAIKYGETSRTAWSPPMAPIKVIMCFGIGLMLLQATARFLKNIAAALGVRAT